MSNTDLINELRTEAARWAGGSWPHAVIKSLLTRAADALEASDAIVHLDVSTEQHRGDGLAADLATAVVRAERAEADNRRLLEERANLTTPETFQRAGRAADITDDHAERAIRAALAGEDE